MVKDADLVWFSSVYKGVPFFRECVNWRGYNATETVQENETRWKKLKEVWRNEHGIRMAQASLDLLMFSPLYPGEGLILWQMSALKSMFQLAQSISAVLADKTRLLAWHGPRSSGGDYTTAAQGLGLDLFRYLEYLRCSFWTLSI